MKGAGTPFPIQAPSGWVPGVSKELKGVQPPQHHAQSSPWADKAQLQPGKSLALWESWQGHGTKEKTLKMCRRTGLVFPSMSSVDDFSTITWNIQAFTTPGKAGAGSVSVRWRWERRRRPHGGAACVASSLFLPTSRGAVRFRPAGG